MNAAHLHLIINHIPVIGIGVAAFLLVCARIRRSEDLVTGALTLLVLLGAAAGAVYLTGEPAEDVVRHLPDFSHAAVEAHEEAAMVALVGSIAAGLFAAFSLYRWRKVARPQWVGTAALVLALLATGAMGYAANLGGQIRHTEIRASGK